MSDDRPAPPRVPRPSQPKRKINRHGQRHHQRTSDQSRRRRPERAQGESIRRAKKRNRNKGIDPVRFVSKAVAQEQETFVPKHSFKDFGFNETIMENLTARGYRLPTPIQDQAIKLVMQGRDLIGVANTGTGKTAVFVLPIIHALQNAQQRERALILAPTRELASQIEEELIIFAKGLPVSSALLIGGVSMQKQLNALRHNPKVIIATPGRLLDLLQQRKLKLDTVSIFVLDEMDRMLDMGFIKDIQKILDLLPRRKQTLCFSATLPPEIKTLLDDLLHNPVTISVRRREAAEHIDQDVVVADTREEKLKMLITLLREQHYTKVLVFGRTKWGVQKLAQKLSQAGITAEAIHGNKTQPQRVRALDAFKSGNVSTLVATDVAARGLDIDDVSHVINFDQPATYDDYVHRIGRTGRAGKKGHALTFISSAEAKQASDDPNRRP